MKIFFDTEFTGLHKNTTLISIGLVSENNQCFYAEFIDYDINQVDDWVETHVIKNLIFNDISHTMWFATTTDNWIGRGTKQYIKSYLKKWLLEFDKVEIWSDCLSYDWVLFNDIFGTAFDIPINVYYIPFDICTLFKIKNIDPDISREQFTETTDILSKHNSLYNAQIIKKCYDKLMKI